MVVDVENGCAVRYSTAQHAPRVDDGGGGELVNQTDRKSVV